MKIFTNNMITNKAITTTTITLTCCLVLSLAVGLTLSSCGVDDSCVDGKACVCDGDCDQTCGGSGKGCSFSCPAGASCNYSCPGGGCSASGAGKITLDCPGNGCSLTCSGSQTCKITSCSSTCQLSCGGAADCSNSCDLMSGCTKD